MVLKHFEDTIIHVSNSFVFNLKIKRKEFTPSQNDAMVSGLRFKYWLF